MQPRRRPSGCLSCLGGLIILTAVLIVVLTGSTLLIMKASPLSAFSSYPANVAAEEIIEQVTADLAETPHFAPAKPAAAYPIDPSVPDSLVPALQKGFDLMRGTPQGASLFDELMANDVTVSVKDLPYNAGYTDTSWTESGWVSSNIVVAKQAVRSRSADVLAAILIHESAHVDRGISGTACYYDNSCTELSNGIELQEEEYAHSVEARFWEAMYGDNGKSLAIDAARGENALLKAYLQGTTAFDQYVRDSRSDPREGEGVT